MKILFVNQSEKRSKTETLLERIQAESFQLIRSNLHNAPISNVEPDLIIVDNSSEEDLPLLKQISNQQDSAILYTESSLSLAETKLRSINEELRQKRLESFELRNINDNLKAKETLLHKLSMHLPGVIYQFQLRPDGTSFFPYVSENIRTIHGFAPEELYDDASIIFELIHPDDLEGVLHSIQESYQQLTLWEHDYRIDLPHLGERWHKGVASPEKLGDGSVRWHGYMVDVTDMKMIENRLRVEKDRAEKSDRIKSQFLANMSHELRTPMNGIMGMIQLLETTELDEEQQQYVELSLKSSMALTTVINDILTYTSLESQKTNLQDAAFDPVQLMVEVIELHRIAAVGKHLRIDYEVFSEVPVVMGDRYKLKQILNHLTGNAVKFTESGGVHLSLDATETGNGNSVLLTFQVKDTGSGIPSDKLKQVFDDFYQVDDTDTRKYGGIGLGLTITRELVQILDGKIEAESQLGEGSSFTVAVEMTKKS